MISNAIFSMSLLILVATTSFSCEKQPLGANQVTTNPFLEKNKYGMARLHCVTFLDEINRNTLPAMDDKRAQWAAWLIKEHGADVNEKDNYGHSPFDYANGMKFYLPKVFEVMQAGKTIQETSDQAQKTDSIAWQMALNTLEIYVESYVKSLDTKK